MTIKKNTEWGQEVAQCPPHQCVGSDHEMGTHLNNRTANVFVLAGGSLFETLGRPSAPIVGGVAHCLPCDAITVSIVAKGTQIELTAVNDVAIRNSWSHGGWLRGPVLVVTNTGMRRGRQIATRAHPNDGHLDVVSVATMNIRQRVIGWSKAKLGNHVPHPKIVISRTTHLDLTVSPKQLLVIDGRRHNHVSRVTLTIASDAAHVLIASGTNL